MLAGLKKLSLMSKILFLLSLVVLFIWVIPKMVNYYENVHKYEAKVKELQQIGSQYGIAGEAQPFTIELFKKDTASLSSKVIVESPEDKVYNLTMHIDKDKISNFNSFLETLSLRYLVKIDGALQFEEKDKVLEVKMTFREL
ncbi:hypothetical protein KKC13_10425 [bacterium]|nr:hypothetical protein [bacterium]MBU1956857.1 hypothetical protein [bacterium]